MNILAYMEIDRQMCLKQLEFKQDIIIEVKCNHNKTFNQNKNKMIFLEDKQPKIQMLINNLILQIMFHNNLG